MSVLCAAYHRRRAGERYSARSHSGVKDLADVHARSVRFAYAACMVRSQKIMLTAVCVTASLGACDRGGAPATAGGPTPSAPASAGVAPAATTTTQAVITLDAAHDVMTKKDAPAYAVAPSASLVMEVGGHRFPMLDGAGAGVPDAVHVVRGSSGYYRASFSGKRVTLDARSLDPVKGRDAFVGFEAGESYIIAVGTEAPSASDGAMRFLPVWSAKVNVTSK
jgi:hypothetical protein